MHAMDAQSTCYAWSACLGARAVLMSAVLRNAFAAAAASRGAQGGPHEPRHGHLR
jgi:hypothetical protein